MSSTSNASFSCCFWGIAETARETLLDMKILYIINIYYFLLLVNLRIKKEPVTICNQVPSMDLWDCFSHFSSSTPLRYKRKKTQDYYTAKYTFPVLSQSAKMGLFLKFVKIYGCYLLCWGALPVLLGMVPNADV